MEEAAPAFESPSSCQPSTPRFTFQEKKESRNIRQKKHSGEMSIFYAWREEWTSQRKPDAGQEGFCSWSRLSFLWSLTSSYWRASFFVLVFISECVSASSLLLFPVWRGLCDRQRQLFRTLIPTDCDILALSKKALATIVWICLFKSRTGYQHPCGHLVELGIRCPWKVNGPRRFIELTVLNVSIREHWHQGQDAGQTRTPGTSEHLPRHYRHALRWNT